MFLASTVAPNKRPERRANAGVWHLSWPTAEQDAENKLLPIWWLYFICLMPQVGLKLYRFSKIKMRPTALANSTHKKSNHIPHRWTRRRGRGRTDGQKQNEEQLRQLSFLSRGIQGICTAMLYQLPCYFLVLTFTTSYCLLIHTFSSVAAELLKRKQWCFLTAIGIGVDFCILKCHPPPAGWHADLRIWSGSTTSFHLWQPRGSWQSPDSSSLTNPD